VAATNWKPAHDASIVYSGVTFKCTSASVSVDIEQFETTNTESNGAYEFGLGVKRISLSFEIPVDDDTPVVPTEGAFATATWSDGASTYTGDGAITRIGRRGGGRGGFSVSGEITFTGSVTKS
jgi:hypothetical protein